MEAEMSTNQVLACGSPRLDNLPTEILAIIIFETLDIHKPICATIQKGLTTWSMEEIAMFQQKLPKKMAEQLLKLFLTNKQVRAQTQQCLARNARFYASSSMFSHFPIVVGLDTTKALQKVTLRLSLGDKICHEETWPDLISTLTQDLTSLCELTIETTWNKAAERLDLGITKVDGARVTRGDQEVALLLRLGSFVNLRHANLNRLIWSVASIHSSDIDEGYESARIVLDRGMIQKPGDLHRKWETTVSEDGDAIQCVEDQILNATKIRRTKLDHLMVAQISDFVISPQFCYSKDDITTSETELRTKGYHIIERRGYTKEAERKARCWGYLTADEMIEHAEEMRSKSWKARNLFEMIANEQGQRRSVEEQLHRAQERLVFLELEYRSLKENDKAQKEELDHALMTAKSAEDAASSAEWEAEFLRAELDRQQPMVCKISTTNMKAKTAVVSKHDTKANIVMRRQSKPKRLLKF